MQVEVEFSAGGKKYKLFFDNRAFRTVEKSMGRPLSLMQDSVSDFTILLHAGLGRHHPELSADDVDEIINELGYDAMMEVLSEAIKESPPLRKRTPPK